MKCKSVVMYFLLSLVIWPEAAQSQVAIAMNDAAILYSPFNWLVTSSAAKTINSGAYFKLIFSGTSCKLMTDTSANASPYSEFWVRVDGGPFTEHTLAAGNPTFTLATGLANHKHFLEVVVKSTSQALNRWTSQSTGITFSGLMLDNGAIVTKPVPKAFNILIYGDSITEGVLVNGSAGIPNDTDQNDVIQDYSWLISQEFPAEIGVVGFGSRGATTTGSGGVPPLPASYQYLWSGQPRSFTNPAPNVILYNIGTTDRGSNITAAMTQVVTNLQLVVPNAKQILLLPFNGTHADELQSVVAAVNSSNVTFGDTTGFWDPADSGDGTHPYGYAHIGYIAPNVVNLLLQIPLGPVITLQPAANTNLSSGASWTFAAKAVGIPAPSYQWFVNGTNLPGATNNTLTLSNLHSTNSGNYYVVASNASGSVTSAVVQVAINNVSISQGLVSYWPLQTINTNTTPNTTPDLVSGYDMSLMNMSSANLVPTTNPSNAGLTNAMMFNGTSTYLKYTGGGNLPISVSPAFSVLLWVQGYGSQADAKVFAEGSTASTAPATAIGTQSAGANNSLRFYIRNAASTVLLDTSSTNTAAPFDNSWHHIAVVVNHGVATMYIDGMLDHSSSFSGAISGLNSTTIGAILRTSLSFVFTGQINDVAVWARALAQGEIQNVMTNSIQASPSAITGIAKISPTSLQVSGTGDVSQVYSVWSTTNVALPAAQWSLIGTTNSTSAGVINFTDTNATNANRFYRFGQ
jgi:hypothetical protein